MTSGRRVPTPLTSQQARSAIKGFCRRLTVKPVPGDSLSQLLTALSAQPRTGQGVFDLFLIAQMKGLGIGDVCTYNGGDFAFPGIRALEPADVIKIYGAA